MSEIFNNMNIPYTAAPKVAEQVNSQPVSVKEAVAASKVGEQNADTVEISGKNKQNPVKAVKGFIAKIKKFFATTGEYVSGTAKGLAAAVVSGSVVYTAGSIVNAAKAKSAAKAGTVAKKIPNKVLAAVVGGIALAGSIWNASLNASEKNSNIDHRWTGHQK